MRRAFASLILAAMALCAGGAASAAPAPQAFTIDHYTARGLTLASDGASPAGTYAVADPALHDRLALTQHGDAIVATVDTGHAQLLGVTRITRPIDPWARVFALGLTFGLLVLGASLVTNGRPQQFLIGVDNRYSNSQCQVTFWFAAVATVYGAATILRVQAFDLGYLGGVAIPEHLAEVTGLSALTFGGAKIITSSKLNPPPPVGGAAPAASALQVKPSAARPNFVRDLVSNDEGRADFGDFQMILVTGAAVLIFLGQAFQFLGDLELAPTVLLPDLDTTLLASFGIGQGAYLLKKAAADPGKG